MRVIIQTVITRVAFYTKNLSEYQIIPSRTDLYRVGCTYSSTLFFGMKPNKIDHMYNKYD